MEREIRKTCAGFAKAELLSKGDALDAPSPGLLKEILLKAAGAGFFGFLVPESEGGIGLGLRDYFAFLEELARSSGAVSSMFVAHHLGLSCALSKSDSAASKSLLASITQSEAVGVMPLCTLALKENKNRDPVPALVETEARFEGGRCLLKGKKLGVIGAEVAAHLVVIATEPGQKGFVVVAMPTSARGLEIGESRERLGLRLCPVNDVSFRDVELSDDHVIARDLDYNELEKCLTVGSAGFGAVALGLMMRAYDIALKYSLERYQGGKIICDHEAVRIMLGEMIASIKTAQSLLRDASSGMYAASYAADAAERVCIDAIQILGGYGYMKDYKVEWILRDVKTLKPFINPAAWKMKSIKDILREVRE